MRRLLLVAVLPIPLASPATLSAQDPNSGPGVGEPPRSVTAPGGGREGWVLGLDMFAGNGLESSAAAAAGMGVHVGRMLNPSLAVMLDTHGAAVGTSDIDGYDVSASVRVRAVAAAAVQWWPARRFWLRGGVGPGRIEGATTSVLLLPTAEIEPTRTGLGATVAGGFELYRGRLFALDLHGRYAGVRAGGDGVSTLLAGLGFTWYPNTTSLEGPVPVGGTAPEPTGARWRDRFVLSVGFLGGAPINNDCSDCYWDAGAGASFQVGWMLTSRLALMLDTHGVAVGESRIPGYEDEANALVQGVVAVAAQYWAGPRIWIKGGLGGGEVRASATVTSNDGASFDITETEKGLGTLAAVGYEFYQGRSLGLSLEARYAGIHGDGLSRAGLLLGVGLAWYP